MAARVCSRICGIVKTVTLAVVIDDAYALGAAALLASVDRRLAPDHDVDAYVCHDVLSADVRGKLENSFRGSRIRLRCIDVSPRTKVYRALFGDERVPHTYWRWLVPSVLPAGVPHVLYLDADMIVTGDLSALWPLRGAALVQAVPDVFPRRVPYGNNGLLLIDVQRWKSERIAERAEAHRRAHPEKGPDRDQHALNAVIADAWAPLSARWNVCARHDALPADAGIVHFLNSGKPWRGEGLPFERRLFLEALAHTAWRGWTPPTPSAAFRLWDAVRRRGIRICNYSFITQTRSGEMSAGRIARLIGARRAATV